MQNSSNSGNDATVHRCDMAQYFDENGLIIEHPRMDSLISDNAPNETAGTIQFASNFSLRYGERRPAFRQCTLDEAMREALFTPTALRKQLAIYIHDDRAILANILSKQVMCSENIVDYVTKNYVIWGWDITNMSNAQLLLQVISVNFGDEAASLIRSMKRVDFPMIIIVSRLRSSNEISAIIHGAQATTADEMLVKLTNATEIHLQQRATCLQEEAVRNIRLRVQREQDEAYAASLLADKVKDETKAAMQKKKRQEEISKREAAEEIQKLRALKAKLLPAEPQSNCKDTVCVLKCRLPEGKVLSRKFLKSTLLTVVFDYLYVEGFSREEYRFLTAYPKRDITELPDYSEMKDLFASQDTMIVEKR